MANSVPPVPEGYHTATPYLICDGAAEAIDFYKRAFGAVEMMRMPMPDGKLGHAELKIGDSLIMLADENAESGARSPKYYGGTPVSVLLYVKNVDALFEQAYSAIPCGTRSGIVGPQGIRASAGYCQAGRDCPISFSF